LYVQKTIKVFIDLIWERYSKAIQRMIFYPYVVYLIFFIMLGTSVNDGYLTQLEAKTQTTGGFIYFLTKLALCLALWAW
jgi:hypothetical protein